jgi:aminoglycoside phosphotransferase (APT) family kinase protein
VCEQRLLRAVPAGLPATVVHGDYRLGNMLCEGHEVKAIIDWEIWSLNDPRLDVGWMTMIADPNRPQSRRIDLGMPSPERLLKEYESASGTTVADFEWFCGLMRYKLAATSSLITKNNRRRENPDPDGESHASYAAAVLDQALEYLS